MTDMGHCIALGTAMSVSGIIINSESSMGTGMNLGKGESKRLRTALSIPRLVMGMPLESISSVCCTRIGMSSGVGVGVSMDMGSGEGSNMSMARTQVWTWIQTWIQA